VKVTWLLLASVVGVDRLPVGPAQAKLSALLSGSEASTLR